jgi:hypothetical protein
VKPALRPALALALLAPGLSGCLTAAAALMVVDLAETDRRARESYHLPRLDIFAQDGEQAFDGPFGPARLRIEDGVATVALPGCATFSGRLQSETTPPYAWFASNIEDPRPEWRRVWGLEPERIQVLAPACEGLGRAQRVQMVTAYRGRDRGGYGSALFVQGLLTADADRFVVADEQVFAKAFGSP